MRNISTLSLSHGERVPEGWVRGSKPLVQDATPNYGTPHPTLRATFSPWEKGKFTRFIMFFGPMCMGAVGCSSSTTSHEIVFKCFANSSENDVRFASVYVADAKTKVARKVSNEERIGKTEITDSIIKMNFKGNDKAFPLEVKINRYTGAATHEHGNEPFGQFSSENALYEMVCKKIEEKKL